MRKFFKMLLINFIKAIIMLIILSIYAVPMFYVVKSNWSTSEIGLFLLSWVITWIVILITAFQYFWKKND